MIHDSTASRPHVGFVLEQTLGHVTHSKNLQSLVPGHESVRASFVPVEFDTSGRFGRVPPWSNWTVRAGVRARRGIRSLHRRDPVEALFIHTQVPAVLVPDVLKRIPTIVSIDATPMQYDELGEHYAHDIGYARVEQLKWRLNRDCFRRAAHMVAWSEWAKVSLVEQYEVDAEKVSVLAPGVDPASWARPDAAPGRDGEVTRFLFVGGDLDRKGGVDLLEAFAALRATRDDPNDVELHLVTGARIDAPPGVTVHNGVTPNSAELIALYHRSDVFCLPTLGDCLPMVLSEAGAAGLPSISTDVGAIREIVVDDQTGLLVPVSDPAALGAAMQRLTADAALRRRLGQQAIEHVRRGFDADHNAGALVELLHGLAVTRGTQ